MFQQMWPTYLKTYLGLVWQRYGSVALAHLYVSQKWPTYNVVNVAQLFKTYLGQFWQRYGTVAVAHLEVSQNWPTFDVANVAQLCCSTSRSGLAKIWLSDHWLNAM